MKQTTPSGAAYIEQGVVHMAKPGASKAKAVGRLLTPVEARDLQLACDHLNKAVSRQKLPQAQEGLIMDAWVLLRQVLREGE